jgi:Holliday junction resolvase
MGNSNIPRVQFRPISEKLLLKMDNKPGTPTDLYYQKGFVNNKIALRFFKEQMIIKTLVSKSVKSWETFEGANIWDVIVELGGQRPFKAHFQREDSLTNIVQNYFQKLGYTIQKQPKLGENTPDLLVTKGKDLAFIELKAYFGKTYVAEAEVAQILKYFALSKQDPVFKAKVESGEINTPKFLFITTGKILSIEKNSLLNGELLKLSVKEQIEFIKKKYRKYVRELGAARSLEARDTRSIYCFAHQKYEKYQMDSNWCCPAVYQLQSPISLDLLIENKSNISNQIYDVFLIPAHVFSETLKDAGLLQEQAIFNKIQDTWLERLIVDNNLIKIDSCEENQKNNHDDDDHYGEVNIDDVG